MTKKSPRRQWKQWSEAEARSALDAWRAAGTSAAQFAQQHGFSPKRLHYWQHRLAQVVPAFVPVVGPRCEDARIEIERAGVVLRVRERIDAETLTAIVAALARVPSPC